MSLPRIQSNDLSLDDFDYGMFNKKINGIFKSIVSENIYEQLFNYPYNKKPFTAHLTVKFTWASCIFFLTVTKHV